MQHLGRLAMMRIEDVTARSVGSKRQLAPLIAALGAPVNSDFHPYLQLEAPRARFVRTNSRMVLELALAPVPVLEMTGGTTISYLGEPAPPYVTSLRLRTQSTARDFARRLLERSADPLLGAVDPAVIAPLLALKRPGALCGTAVPMAAIEQLHRAAELTLAHLPPDLRRALWIERRWLDCAPARLAPAVIQRLDLYAAIAARDAQAMLGLARALLGPGWKEGEESWGRYLLLTAMLGAHATGEREEVQRLWQTYGSALYSDGKVPPAQFYMVKLK